MTPPILAKPLEPRSISQATKRVWEKKNTLDSKLLTLNLRQFPVARLSFNHPSRVLFWQGAYFVYLFKVIFG